MQDSKQALKPINVSLNSTALSREIISYIYLLKKENNSEKIEEVYSEYINELTENNEHFLPAHLIRDFTNISIKVIEYIVSSPTKLDVINSFLQETREWFKTYYACELDEKAASHEAYIKGYAHGTIELTKKIADLYCNAILSKQLLSNSTIKELMHFICTIAISPNISHFELAKELGLSQEELQHLIDSNDLDKSGLYLTVPKGRIRHYKLSDLGNALVCQYKKAELDNYNSQLKNAFMIKETTSGKSNWWYLPSEETKINSYPISASDIYSFYSKESEKGKLFLGGIHNGF